jgi:hypothetical protein
VTLARGQCVPRPPVRLGSHPAVSIVLGVRATTSTVTSVKAYPASYSGVGIAGFGAHPPVEVFSRSVLRTGRDGSCGHFVVWDVSPGSSSLIPAGGKEWYGICLVDRSGEMRQLTQGLAGRRGRWWLHCSAWSLSCSLPESRQHHHYMLSTPDHPSASGEAIPMSSSRAVQSPPSPAGASGRMSSQCTPLSARDARAGLDFPDGFCPHRGRRKSLTPSLSHLVGEIPDG